MRKLIVLITFAVVFVIILAYQIKAEKKTSTKESLEINKDDFRKYIKERPYTILYFWASWCGFAQKGLINDYSKNYQYINNDTVQSILFVASDTNSINSFMVRNNIKVPYKCLHEGEYSILRRNIKDGKNMDKFIKDMFGYKNEFPGFPTVLLVDSSFTVLMNSSETKHAVSNYRYFERKKQLNNKESP